jgi:hypothetical protein
MSRSNEWNDTPCSGLRNDCTVLQLVSRAGRFTASNRMSYGDHLMYPACQTPYLSECEG